MEKNVYKIVVLGTYRDFLRVFSIYKDYYSGGGDQTGCFFPH